MKKTLQPSHPIASSAAENGAEATSDTASAGCDCSAMRDFVALFRSHWNCAILHALRPRKAGLSPPQLRRFQLNRSLEGALEKSVSNALDTLQDAGLIARGSSTDKRGVFYSLTPDGLSALPMLREIDATCRRFRALLRRAHVNGRNARRQRRRRRSRRAKI